MKTTLILGASEKPERYSYRAINNLVEQGNPVIAIGAREGKVHGVNIITGMPDLQDIHTVTLYISLKIQQSYYDYILKLRPKRIIFNPGTENHELKALAEKNGIETLEACTLVMLSLRNY
jgi:hypothetical protein